MHFTYVIKEKVCHSSVICIFYTLPGKCKTKQNQLNKHKTRINPLCLLQKKERKKERNLVPILIGGEQCLILPTHLIQRDLNCGNNYVDYLLFRSIPHQMAMAIQNKMRISILICG